MNGTEQHKFKLHIFFSTGDSDYISRVIEECGGRALVASYTGVDLSAPAMEISKENIHR